MSTLSRTGKLPRQKERIDPAVRRMVFTIIVGALAVVFDTTIINVALHDLATDLRAPLSTSSGSAPATCWPCSSPSRSPGGPSQCWGASASG